MANQQWRQAIYAGGRFSDEGAKAWIAGYFFCEKNPINSSLSSDGRAACCGEGAIASSRKISSDAISIKYKTFHARKIFVQERQVARVPLSVEEVNALNYLELHVQSKICASEIQSFLLLNHFKCPI